MDNSNQGEQGTNSSSGGASSPYSSVAGSASLADLFCENRVIAPNEATWTYLKNKPVFPQFVGAMECGDSFSMVCLIEDGTVLVPLHSIYDLQKGSILNLAEASVTFA